MIGEFELFHGAAIRELIVSAPAELRIKVRDDLGRVNCYLLNDEVAVQIKHSSKRLPPWQFSFTEENLDELERLSALGRSLWLLLVCGLDGLLALSAREFYEINPRGSETTNFVRVDRDRRTMYRVTGTGGKLMAKKPRGLAAVISDAFAVIEEKQ